jgi:hypothetical protein
MFVCRCTGPSSPMRSYQERSLSRRPSMNDVPEHELGPSTSQVRSPTPPQENGNYARGRRGSLFGLSSVSNVLINAVRSSSPQTSPKFQRSRERDRSEDMSNGNRGRTMERAVDENARISVHVLPSTSTARSRGRESKERLSFGTFFGKAADDKAKDAANGWKEFKKGSSLSYENNDLASHISFRDIYLPNILSDSWQCSTYDAM